MCIFPPSERVICALEVKTSLRGLESSKLEPSPDSLIASCQPFGPENPQQWLPNLDLEIIIIIILTASG